MGVRAGPVPVARRPATGLSRAYTRQKLGLHGCEQKRRGTHHTQARCGVNRHGNRKPGGEEGQSSQPERVPVTVDPVSHRP